MKINAIALTSLILADIGSFITKLIILINKEGADKLKISSQYNNLLLPAAEKFDKAYQKSKKGKFTVKIEELDKSRDNITAVILGIINTMLKSDDPLVAAAAKNLKRVFDEFKGITKNARDRQSTKTTNLLQMIRSEYAADATKLGLDDWLDKLEALNKEVVAAEIERVEEKAEKGKFDAAEAKKEFISAYRMMCMQLKASVAAEGSANYENFIRNLNALISEYGGAGGTGGSAHTPSGDNTPDTPLQKGNEEGDDEKYPNAREWSEDIDYQTCASGDIFYIVRNGVKEYYKLLDFGEVATFEPGMDDGGIWEKLS